MGRLISDLKLRALLNSFLRMTVSVAQRIRYILRFDKERFLYYRNVALLTLGAFLIVAMASQFDQWLTEHKSIHLEYSIALLLLTCAFFFLVPNRMFIGICALAFVVLLGVVGMIVNLSITPLPLVLVCGVADLVLIKWKGGTIKLK
jgi:hypothetical protein